MSDQEAAAAKDPYWINRISALDPGRTALLVVDMQHFFLDGSGPRIPDGLSIMPKINQLSRALRGAGGLVVIISHTVSDAPRYRLNEWQDRTSPRTSDGDYILRQGYPEQAVHPGIEISASDLRLPKHRYSALLSNSSDLDAQLRERGIDTLIICGIATNVCCESTARDGNMLGYRILFASDATAATTRQEHEASLLNLSRIFATVADTEAIAHMITAAHE